MNRNIGFTGRKSIVWEAIETRKTYTTCDETVNKVQHLSYNKLDMKSYICINSENIYILGIK